MTKRRKKSKCFFVFFLAVIFNPRIMSALDEGVPLRVHPCQIHLHVFALTGANLPDWKSTHISAEVTWGHCNMAHAEKTRLCKPFFWSTTVSKGHELRLRRRQVQLVFDALHIHFSLFRIQATVHRRAVTFFLCAAVYNPANEIHLLKKNPASDGWIDF